MATTENDHRTGPTRLRLLLLVAIQLHMLVAFRHDVGSRWSSRALPAAVGIAGIVLASHFARRRGSWSIRNGVAVAGCMTLVASALVVSGGSAWVAPWLLAALAVAFAPLRRTSRVNARAPVQSLPPPAPPLPAARREPDGSTAPTKAEAAPPESDADAEQRSAGRFAVAFGSLAILAVTFREIEPSLRDAYPNWTLLWAPLDLLHDYNHTRSVGLGRRKWQYDLFWISTFAFGTAMLFLGIRMIRDVKRATRG